MTWLEALPIIFVATLWLLLPGIGITYALGLRGIAAWALAPVTTIALVGTTAVVANKLGISWSPLLLVVVCAVVTAMVAAGALLLRRRTPVVHERDPLSINLTAIVGLLVAIVVGAITIKVGFVRPDALSHTYDAVFHYNAIALILDSGNASSLTMGTLHNPDIRPEFYPAAWHTVASLIISTTGTSIPVVANLLTTVIVLVVWPMSCLLLARQIFGRSRAALAVTGLLSLAFPAFPWALIGSGVLWPNTLGLALCPAGLAVLVSLFGLAKDDAIGKGRAWLLLPVCVLAAGFGHPNSLFTFVALALFPAGAALLRRSLRLHRERRTVRAAGDVVGALAIFGLAWWWAATTPLFANQRTYPRAPQETPAMSVGEVLLNATSGRRALWILSALVLVGVVVSIRTVSLRWLVAGHAASGFLYMIAAALPRPETQMFTGYWYNDPARLAAMLPITGIPLAVAGTVFLARKTTSWLEARAASDERPGWQRRVVGALNARLMAAVVAVFSAVLIVTTSGLNSAPRLLWLTPTYQPPRAWMLVDPTARDFFAKIKHRIPEDSLVAGNPWDGSVLIWALADRRTLYSHLYLPTSSEQDYLALHLTDAIADPKACAAINHLKVGFLLIGNSTDFWPGASRVLRDRFPGLADPGPSKPGFELIEQDGPLKLYRITACETSPATQPAGG